jgi:hypothetical protein
METNSFRLMTSLDELESILDKFTQKNEVQQQQQHHQQQQQQHSGYASHNYSEKINNG